MPRSETMKARRAIAIAVIGTELVASLGLVVVVAQLSTNGELLCPSDATCSAPNSLFAVVAIPVTFAATVAVMRAGLADRIPTAHMAVFGGLLVATFVMLVVIGSLYRIDVPRP